MIFVFSKFIPDWRIVQTVKDFFKVLHRLRHDDKFGLQIASVRGIGRNTINKQLLGFLQTLLRDGVYSYEIKIAYSVRRL